MRPSKLFHPTRMRELSLIRQWVARVRRGRICDLGCGDGEYTRLLTDTNPVCAFDPSLEQIRKAVNQGPARGDTVSFLVADATAMPYRDVTFEAVVSVCVLEHIRDLSKAVQEVHRVLKNGGFFLSTVDSMSEPHTPQRYLDYHHERFHIADYLPLDKVRTLLEQNGFEILAYRSLIRNRLSGFIVRLFACNYRVYRWVSPLLCLMCLVTDSLWGSRERGYKLFFAARKKNGGWMDGNAGK